MDSERQRIEAPPPNPVVDDHMPPPPSYDEASNTFSENDDIPIDAMGYFLGEVFCIF